MFPVSKSFAKPSQPIGLSVHQPSISSSQRVAGKATLNNTPASNMDWKDVVIAPVLIKTTPPVSPSPAIKHAIVTNDEELLDRIKDVSDRGISKVKLFADSHSKDKCGTTAFDMKQNPMLSSIKLIKENYPKITIMTELCFCAYTEDSNCQLKNDNDVYDDNLTLSALEKYAILQAKSGADVVGPAGMVKNSVLKVRKALDSAGFENVKIMPHLIMKSALYRQYRQQMTPNMPSILLDRPTVAKTKEEFLDMAKSYIDEGADSLLLEPGMFIADLGEKIHADNDIDLAYFSVSGESNMLLNSGDPDLIEEAYSGLIRTGAKNIVTYLDKILVP